MTNTPPQPEPDDPTQCSGEEGFCPEHGFHRHTLKQPGTADAKPADQAAVLREAADRGAVSATLWAAAEHHTVAEWICCDPINPDHPLCAQGGAALQMLQALLVDDPEAWKPAPLLDEVMRLLPTADQAETERLRAERDSLGREAERLRTDWTAMRDRAERAWADRDWWRDRAYAVQARAERADRAAVLREAADVAERLMDERYGPDCSYGVGGRDVARELRRLADEAPQQPDDRGPWGTRPRCNCPHAADEHSVYGCEDDCGCEWMPKPKPKPTPMNPWRILGIADCPTPESHNWGCGCPTDQLPLHAESGVDTSGCDCGHDGMGPKWHAKACAWTATLNVPHPDAVADEAPEPEPPVHGESVAHLAGIHDNAPAADARQDGAQQS